MPGDRVIVTDMAWLQRLSNWPRYPGGAIAGASLAIASVLLFFIGPQTLRSYLPGVLVIAVVLWVLLEAARRPR